MNFLGKNIINLGEKIFGLDLSDISVKVLELEKEGEGYNIRSFFSQDIPEGSLEDGIIFDKPKIISAIKEALSKAGPKKINTQKVICSLPESKAFLRVVNIPRMSEKEAQEAVKWEIEASIPLSVDQVYFDWQFIGNSNGNQSEKNKQEVLTVAVSKEVVDSYMDIFREAGLEVYGLELESVAIARSLIEKDEASSEASLIVDLGSKRTSFIIVEGNVPYFTSSIPFSSVGITDAISKYLNFSAKEAEDLKINKGLENCWEDDSVLRAIEPLLENLTSEIEKSIDFYGSLSKERSQISRIILSGGGSNMKGLVPYLAKKIGKNVEDGDPWTNLVLGNKLPVISKANSSSYSTVVGLGLRGMAYGD